MLLRQLQCAGARRCAMLFRQFAMHRRNNALAQDGVHHMGEQCRGEQWATARRCNAREQWGAIRGREVMNARLADGDTGGRYGRANA